MSNFVFLTDVNFARPTGAKDKKKRKSRLRQLAPLLAPVGILGSLGLGAYGLNKIEERNTASQKKRNLDEVKEILDYEQKGRIDYLNKLEEMVDSKNGRKKIQETLEDKLAKDRRSKSYAKVGLVLDDADLDRRLANKTSRGANRLRNLNKIMRGSVSDKFAGLATDLHVLKNVKKYNLDKVARKNLIKQVAGKLKYLKATGLFSYSSKNITFARKDKQIRRKKPLMLGEKLSTRLRKGVTGGVALGTVGTAAQDLITQRKINLGRVAKGGLIGGSIGGGMGTLTWGLSPRSPIPSIRKWQQNRNK